jgi:hypothetical protein
MVAMESNTLRQFLLRGFAAMNSLFDDTASPKLNAKPSATAPCRSSSRRSPTTGEAEPGDDRVSP